MELKKKHTNSDLVKNLAFANIFGRGRRPFCSELFKGLPGVCPRGKKADRPLGGHLVACLAGGSVVQWRCNRQGGAVQVHPGLEDLLLVGKISPQIDSED